MNPPNFTFQNPFLHSRIVQDNHYGAKPNQQTAEFIIDTIDNIESHPFRICDEVPSNPLSGLHYIVCHNHAFEIKPSDNLGELYKRVCWDITLLNKILYEIPRCYHNAITILSKEIGMDMALKLQIENTLRLSYPVYVMPFPAPPQELLPNSHPAPDPAREYDITPLPYIVSARGASEPPPSPSIELLYEGIPLSPLQKDDPLLKENLID